jgi:hypothetical protein
MGVVPDPVPNPDYHRQVLGETRPEVWLADYRLACKCGSRTTGWPASWVEWTMTTSSSATFPCSSLMPPEPGWSICPLRRSPTGTTWSKPSPATSRAHTCALGLHSAIFEAAHRAAQHHRLGCHRRVPRRPHLPRPGEQAGSQDSHQGERADGHRHQVRLWLGGGRGHLPEGQAASGAPTGRRPRGVRSVRHQEEGQEEVASETRRRRRKPCRRRRVQEPSEASRKCQPVRQDAQGVVPLSSRSRQAHP